MSKQTIRRFGLAISVATAIVVAFAASPVAAGSTIQIDGLLTPDTAGVCTNDPLSVATYTVTGSLEGCWYIEEWTIDGETPSGATKASGHEVFEGCLGDLCRGTFRTTYTFTYRIVDGVEVHGRCHHPVVDGDGVFAGVTGMIQMHDLPNGCAVYGGHLRF